MTISRYRHAVPARNDDLQPADGERTEQAAAHLPAMPAEPQDAQPAGVHRCELDERSAERFVAVVQIARDVLATWGCTARFLLNTVVLLSLVILGAWLLHADVDFGVVRIAGR
ncbi:hypothetical protein [Amycolatopsis sp. H20-H5]|uniref:hypothetical protein n=1 Tax=Amycolatopsis sp. H20-H5 TaxID=3046309 RepID=UPI002DB9D13A|nr:hypothetical protein [Amycolatopsis sp. H20-H5]MEC3978063.1 hypothetical protein [Amycolatopsis sp. H20-H5]